MAEDTTKRMGNFIRIDVGEIRGHLTELVKGTVEETLNAMSTHQTVWIHGLGVTLGRCTRKLVRLS